MRKTLNINLGGMAFIIDENAFDLLHNYLEALKRKFNNAAEREEILNDIEARIAEMLGQRLSGSKEVVSMEDVQSIMETMGKPEDIAGEESTTETSSSSTSSSSASYTTQAPPVKRRLFRDPDDAKIGGVISGLCHYFGIADPVWMRVAALALIFFSATAVIPLYIILLIVIPKATTAAEKLQMKGEPVNINTIEKEIKDAAGRMSESVNKIVKDGNVFDKIWDVISTVLKAFLKVFAVFDIVISMICLAAITICFVVFYILGTSPYTEASRLVVDSPSTLTLFSFGFLLFLAAPFVGLVYLGIRILLNQRSAVRWFRPALFAIWFIGLILLITTACKMLTNFGQDGMVKHTATLTLPSHGNLYVRLTDLHGEKASTDEEENQDVNLNVSGGRLLFNGVDFSDVDKINLGRPSLQLIPSENDSFYIQEIITAQGRSRTDAEKNAEMVIYSFSQADSVLNLQHNFYLGKSAKWRSQQMKLRIAIPEGKKIRFADNIDMWAATVKGDADYDDTYFANTAWTVEKGKVKCIEGENHRNTEAENKTGKTERKLKRLEEKINELEKKTGGNKPDKESEDKDKDGDY